MATVKSQKKMFCSTSNQMESSGSLHWNRLGNLFLGLCPRDFNSVRLQQDTGLYILRSAQTVHIQVCKQLRSCFLKQLVVGEEVGYVGPQPCLSVVFPDLSAGSALLESRCPFSTEDPLRSSILTSVQYIQKVSLHSCLFPLDYEILAFCTVLCIWDAYEMLNWEYNFYRQLIFFQFELMNLICN